MTGQCDHLMGMVISPFPQFGEMDRLVKASEHISVDEPFTYCPMCGSVLFGFVNNSVSATYADTIES